MPPRLLPAPNPPFCAMPGWHAASPAERVPPSSMHGARLRVVEHPLAAIAGRCAAAVFPFTGGGRCAPLLGFIAEAGGTVPAAGTAKAT